MEDILLSMDEMSEEQRKEFEKLTEDYSNVLQLMNLFIEVNNIDYDEAWNKANQQYDEDMTYAPNE